MYLAIMDYNRTLFDPDNNGLISGAVELLNGLKFLGATMILVSKNEPGREGRLYELGIVDFFEEVLFVDGKTEALFQEVIARYQAEKVYVIGDHPYQEIRAGNQTGAFTIQFKQGRFAKLAPEIDADKPDAEIVNLPDALKYIF